MPIPTKFIAIALVLSGFAAFACRSIQTTSPAATVQRLVSAVSHGDVRAGEALLMIDARRAAGVAASLADPTTLAIAGKTTLHAVRPLPSRMPDTAQVEVEASHVPIGEVIGIALVAGLVGAFGGGEEVTAEANAAIAAIPASARSTVTVTLTRSDDGWRVPMDARNGEFLLLLGLFAD